MAVGGQRTDLDPAAHQEEDVRRVVALMEQVGPPRNRRILPRPASGAIVSGGVLEQGCSGHALRESVTVIATTLQR